MKKELIKHYAVHTPPECFCPTCYSVFGRFDSLDRHFKNENFPKCKEEAEKLQYSYYRHILSLYFLGLYETFDICDVFFTKLAIRQRLPLPDAANFVYASKPLEVPVEVENA